MTGLKKRKVKPTQTRPKVTLRTFPRIKLRNLILVIKVLNVFQPFMNDFGSENVINVFPLRRPAWEFEVQFTICCIIRLIALNFIRLDYMWSVSCSYCIRFTDGLQWRANSPGEKLHNWCDKECQSTTKMRGIFKRVIFNESLLTKVKLTQPPFVAS